MKLLAPLLLSLLMITTYSISYSETDELSAGNTFKELIKKVSDEGLKIIPAGNHTCDEHAKKLIKDHFGLNLSERDKSQEDRRNGICRAVFSEIEYGIEGYCNYGKRQNSY